MPSRKEVTRKSHKNLRRHRNGCGRSRRLSDLGTTLVGQELSPTISTGARHETLLQYKRGNEAEKINLREGSDGTQGQSRTCTGRNTAKHQCYTGFTTSRVAPCLPHSSLVGYESDPLSRPFPSRIRCKLLFLPCYRWKFSYRRSHSRLSLRRHVSSNFSTRFLTLNRRLPLLFAALPRSCQFEIFIQSTKKSIFSHAWESQ